MRVIKVARGNKGSKKGLEYPVQFFSNPHLPYQVLFKHIFIRCQCLTTCPGFRKDCPLNCGGLVCRQVRRDEINDVEWVRRVRKEEVIGVLGGFKVKKLVSALRDD